MAHHPHSAVFIRCHEFNLKCAHLFNELEDGVGYDLFFLTHETGKVHDFGGRPRVSFASDVLDGLGADSSYPMSVVHYGDLMFSVMERAKPGYQHYVMLDYDIYFSYLGRAWMELFCHLLEVTEPVIDMVAPQLGSASAGWVWHAAAAKHFHEVYGSFFPVVALSAPAIRCNEARRRMEMMSKSADMEPVFCESFLPSALHEAGFNLVDLNVMLPGSYSLSSFNFTLPAPFRPQADCVIGRLIHPIKAMADAPLLSEAVALVAEVEPQRGCPTSTARAFAAAADLVRDQAAAKGLSGCCLFNRNLSPGERSSPKPELPLSRDCAPLS